MNRQEHLLSCLAEECAEVGQCVSKALRFGLADAQPGQPLTNAERIVAEYTDLVAVMEMLVDEGILDLGSETLRNLAIGAKTAKIEKYLDYAASVGALRS